MHRTLWIVCLGALLVGCGSESLDDGVTAGDPGVSWPEANVGQYLVGMAEQVEGFESGDLALWGAPDLWSVGETDTGVARIIAEGDEISTRLGDTAIELDGDHALALQVTAAGGEASITTEPFVPTARHMMFMQMSEVDARGIVLQVEVLDAHGRTLYEIPAVTGGHRPGLDDDEERLAVFPEIGYDEGYPGRAQFQAIDLGLFHEAGTEIQVRFVQRSMVAPWDFFTLIDNVCVVEVPEAYQADIPVYGPILYP